MGRPSGTAGLVRAAPAAAGHGTHWRDANKTTWHQWYADVEQAYEDL